MGKADEERGPTMELALLKALWRHSYKTKEILFIK